jgi:hypothetical protein
MLAALLGLSAVTSPVVGAQASRDSTCYYSDKPHPARTFTLPGGYRAELRHDDDSVTVEWRCSIAVRDARDSIVWGARGFNTSVGAWTGHDIDGDGQPDAVLGVDTGGGNRCCWAYFVLRLAPKFGVVAELSAYTRFEGDAQGRTIIRDLIPFYSLGPSMAQAPTVDLVRQFRSGTLKDITLEWCPRILADSTRGVGTPVNTTPARRSASRQALEITYDVAETRNAVTSLVLQNLACERQADAARLVNETWPEGAAATRLAVLQKAWAAAAPPKK